MSEPEEPRVVVWTVEFSSQAEKKYRWNATVTVIAATAQLALGQVMARHPDAAIHALHRRSRGELLVDRSSLAWILDPVEEAAP